MSIFVSPDPRHHLPGKGPRLREEGQREQAEAHSLPRLPLRQMGASIARPQADGGRGKVRRPPGLPGGAAGGPGLLQRTRRQQVYQGVGRAIRGGAAAGRVLRFHGLVQHIKTEANNYVPDKCPEKWFACPVRGLLDL